ncbi:hypothetical protein CYMTET_31394 [Cymbomonas tetramitiformis]|uniref:EGF-like domain-containing protein n=1 Tax=Cymbomonas tetramitiformis TaxID=36881 RepID=A0AAE0FGW2_9CHLO|nr:hypothetical protein CYMTET_31394 [Cymbomonas tetramitiformis]
MTILIKGMIFGSDREGKGDWEDQELPPLQEDFSQTGEVVQDKGGLFLQGHKWCYEKRSLDRSNLNYTSISGSSECMCETGYSGDDCRTPLCDEKCMHGKCVRPNKCQCHQGWEGKACEKPICKQKCGHGECHLPNKCKCHAGWAGSMCQVRCEHGSFHPEFEAMSGKPALACQCFEGWHGTACNKPKCMQFGCKHGVCSSPNVCTCDIGWGGPDCSHDLLTPHAKILLRSLAPKVAVTPCAAAAPHH